MKGKRIQFNGRSTISFLLAVLILVIAATPALADEDEGGGYQSGQGQAIFLDDEMGFVSLKVTQPTAITAENPAFVQATNDEEMGFLSLRVGSHIRSRTLARATDESMGYLSLRGAHQFVTSEPQPVAEPYYLAAVDDDAMGHLCLKTAREILAIIESQALVRAQ